MGITCGNSPGTCFTIFVFIDIVLATLSTAFVVIVSSLAIAATYASAFQDEIPKNIPNAKEADVDTGLTIVRVFLGIVMLFIILMYLVEVYLFQIARRGIRNKHYGDCHRWYVIRIVFLVLYVLYSVLSFFTGGSVLTALTFLVVSFYHVYEILVSKEFIESLKGGEIHFGVNPA